MIAAELEFDARLCRTGGSVPALTFGLSRRGGQVLVQRFASDQAWAEARAYSIDAPPCIPAGAVCDFGWWIRACGWIRASVMREVL